jgi:predicted DNA-binding transcriptional regulator AlpA
VYRLEKAGRFVPRVRLTDRMSAWPLGGVVAWIQARPLATTSPPLSLPECGGDLRRLGS